MKFAIITAVYKRPELTDIVLSYYHQLQRELDLTLVAVGSEGKLSRDLCERNGWEYLEARNSPLNEKFNAAVKYLMRFDFDGMVLIGSDDLVSAEIFHYYSQHHDSPHLIGLSGCHFYDCATGEMKYFNGYAQFGLAPSRTVGAGRYFSKRIVEDCDYQLWTNYPRNKMLDSDSTMRLASKNIVSKSVANKETGGVLIDVKYSGNITRLDDIRGCRNVHDPQRIWKYFPANIAERVISLHHASR